MIRFFFRWFFRVFLLVIVLVVAGLLLKDTIIKAIAESRIRKETGMDVKIGKFETGLLSPVVRVEDFVLYNKPEFGGGPFLDMPELYMEYDVGDTARQKFHLKLMRINLREINIVQGAAGQTNLFDILKNLPMPDPTKPRTNVTQFGQIDTLNLSIGKIKVTDLKNPRQNQEIVINLKNEIVRNVRSEEDFYAVLLKIMLRQGITFMMGPPASPSPGAVTNSPSAGRSLGPRRP